ncbi:NADH dehydrogenase (quinone) subunit D [Oscillochloris sp. ZM17-4]|uniref:NADH dehydrogenase (quinone) subunit D n=1 Tax=Oscillochloris sp. ZM17-4 TaxID=2866714 RepID=UPI001C733BF6|nr:NADH dehydrogenase (quinone) subunit D [Oscillochloris sp. ZM17-4]MBX0327875.1 NADH dehydrogenase (quinone) subunit D [Oscillochloris sp. ZM17-4]
MTQTFLIPAPQEITGPALAGATETMVLNMGPHHPSTHGVLRLVLELDGETVVNVAPDIGFLHTGIEKTMESKTYQKAVVLTDRMDYLAPLSNNLCYALAVEKLMQVEVPERAQVVRVLLTELQRVSSHLVWLGTHALDLAAMSVFLYAFREREQILDLFELVSGARMMTSYFRVGGLAYPLPGDFMPTAAACIESLGPRIDEYEDLLTNNPLWLERTVGVGVLDAEAATAYGLSGANLRASGVNYDVRKMTPYSGYETYDFAVPLGSGGDTFDRYQVRMAEMRESLKIARQAWQRLEDLGPGPVMTGDRKVAPPPKEEITHSMESLIHHFKLWTEGFKPPRGDVYVSVESPRGALGCYLVSDGSPKPWRVHFRAPSFVNLQGLSHMAKGRLVADLIALTASLDPVLGEVDR